MTVPTFTPTKFAILTLAAIAAALTANSFSSVDHHSPRADLSSLYRPIEGVSLVNGRLTSNFYLATSDTPTPLTHSADRRGAALPPEPSNMPYRNSAPLAR